MKVRGWVYIIVNDVMPGLIKIGYSTKDPILRAEELASTGTPTPFVLVYDALVYEPRNIEQCAHKELTEKNVGKEWFRCSAIDGVAVIRRLAGTDLISEFSHLSIVPLKSEVDCSVIDVTYIEMTETKCPKCDQRLRFPLKGKKIVTCAACRNKFEYRP